MIKKYKEQIRKRKDMEMNILGDSVKNDKDFLQKIKK